MGKKPVLFIGLVWVGVTLTGCGKTCQNCQPKYNASPTYSSNTNRPAAANAPAMVGDARPAKADTPAPTRIPESTGYSPSSIEQTGATMPGKTDTTPPPSVTKPASQSSLMPRDERPLSDPMPTKSTGRLDDGLAMPTSGKAVAMPPRPVTTSATKPTETGMAGQPLPSIGGGGAPPPPPPPPGSLPSMDVPPPPPAAMPSYLPEK